MSHQVKALEAWLGAKLFLRRAQGLADRPGQVLAACVLRGVRCLGARRAGAVRRIASGTGGHRCAAGDRATLACAAASGARAVFPRLTPSIHALETPPDLRRGLFDFAIFFVDEAPGGCRMVPIDDDVIFPVCTPGIAPTLASPSDLATRPLLRDTSWTGDWDCWLAAASVKGVPTDEGPAFSLYSMAVQAVLDGAGVLMAHAALVAPHIASGALVAPFPTVAHTGRRLAILAPERTSEAATHLIAWLVDHA